MSHLPHSRPSHWTTPARMKYLGPHTGTAPLEITLVLRRRAGSSARVASWPQPPRWRRGEFGQHCGAEPADLEGLRAFAARHGLREIGADAQRRVLHLSGSPQALERAFGVTLGSCWWMSLPRSSAARARLRRCGRR